MGGGVASASSAHGTTWFSSSPSSSSSRPSPSSAISSSPQPQPPPPPPPRRTHRSHNDAVVPSLDPAARHGVGRAHPWHSSARACRTTRKLAPWTCASHPQHSVASSAP
ncbi:hypothetical protein GUJ93_ZPchr0013g35681 [Zizania palustris]|uniref:Uncharacterized protein n=1 Tax=Zizania palustris TaxID=103762 RepID=A0A8J5X2B4_ZIZPA|nr:hypothetical protein GUJ93_ZPchr0013g35681 [Zizania palustris]